MRPVVAGREFHASRLAQLTGITALEFQARQILSDVNYFIATEMGGTREAAALRYRLEAFDPWIARISQLDDVVDPVQSYCDLLVFRFQESTNQETSLTTDEAFVLWLESGRPGYPLA